MRRISVGLSDLNVALTGNIALRYASDYAGIQPPLSGLVEWCEGVCRNTFYTI